ncbi:hypothetical protein QZM25_31610 [Burkholderia contaminans]|uniref:hypothetical protein n=1 Tax=Burkholderia cepacia complex TaxID=87882 RepID=UPI001CF4405D|nr:MULTISPECIES: hypothetical protein [Burkholderia cepacia complex]MCA7889629.1 hypothetical protein [Burkholderia contaminans]MDN7577164.1 hypothetical protein [Burkholderia contaminans]MDN7670350.1 hypothetical protein [Burkholderia vietnamiensis]
MLNDSAQPQQAVKASDRLRVPEYEVRWAELAVWLGEMIVYVDKLQPLAPAQATSAHGVIYQSMADALTG